MNRFSEGTIVIGKRIELTEDEVLKLEIEMIELGRLLETDRLVYDSIGNLLVKYESIVEFMVQQTHSSIQPNSNSSSVPTPIYTASQTYSTGQPSRSAYNEYGNEREV